MRRGFGEKRLSKVKVLSAIIVTFAIISGMFLLSPTASAVQVSVSDVNSSYTAGEVDTFTVSIEIDDGERVPIDNIVAIVEKGGTLVDEMVFSIDATVLKTGSYMTDVSRTGFDVGYGYGYGYRYGYDVEADENVQFGYGYGYSRDTATGVLEYEITLDTTGMSEGTYDLYARLNSSNGGTEHSYDSSSVTFSITAPVKEPPVANAGGPYTVNEGNPVTLDGTGSADPDGVIETYSWSIVNDPSGGASLTDEDTSTPIFHAPSVSESTNVEVKLTVTDNDGASDSDTATVSVTLLPEAPEGPSGPAVFEISNVRVAPKNPEPGEDVIVSCIVKNVGGSEGDYRITVRNVVGGRLMGFRSVNLDPGESTTVKIRLKDLKEGETYRINVNGYIRQFEVQSQEIGVTRSVTRVREEEGEGVDSIVYVATVLVIAVIAFTAALIVSEARRR